MDVLFTDFYSYRIDSTGLRSAALFAGRYPKVIPTSTEKPNAIITE
jgi:hypothetical protein